jgi:hypothetical protein
MKSRLFLTIIVLCSISMMASDSCKVTVNVKRPAVSFVVDTDGTKGGSMDVAPGQSFQIYIPYQNGKAPYTCALANAPSWMKVDSTTPFFCGVTGTVPDKNPDGTDFADGSFTGDLTVTDAIGTSAKMHFETGPQLAAKGAAN